MTDQRRAWFSLFAAALVCLFATSADAGWYRTKVTVVTKGGSHGSHGASTGSWGSSGSHGWGSWGSHGGLLHRLHHRLHHSHVFGSHGSHGSSGGSHGKVYYGSCGSHGSGTHVIPQHESTAPDPPAPTDDDPAEAKSSDDDGSATLIVDLPQDARLTINGSATTSTGAKRTFVSRNLESGLNYTYHLQAEVTRDGVVIKDSKSITLMKGEQTRLSFAFSEPQVETVLTVHVPEDARVFLAGRESRSMGAARTFRTRDLAAGQAWEDYHVRVTLEKNGKLLQEDRRVTLRSGDKMVLNFSDLSNPATARVAATR